MTIDKRLAELGIALPAPRAPAFAYVPVAVHGGLAWVSGQLPWEADGSLSKGKLGVEINVEQGKRAARLCIVNGLSVLKAALGSLDRVERIVKVVGFVASAPGFVEQPAVVDGSSSMLGEIFAEAGRHARSAIGVAELPRGVPVEIEFVAAIRVG
ncbi:MAG: RidA family protein [Alphaproteobacteria bacterium]|nr:RidA family protein [Alphaproteobacteria bacterium]